MSRICFMLFVGFVSTLGIAQSFIRIPADNNLIEIRGALNLTKCRDSVVINRFSYGFLKNNTSTIKTLNANTQSGIVVAFKSNSPTTKVHFIKRNDSENRELILAIYKNNSFWAYSKGSTTITLQSDSKKLTDWKIVLPVFYGLHFAGIEIENGSKMYATAKTKKPTYIAIGNSITHGVGLKGVASDKTYPYVLADFMGWELYNLAVGGSKITPSIADETKAIQANTISVLWGYNDWNTGKSIMGDVIPRYKELLVKLRTIQPRAIIYCILPTATKTLQPRTGEFSYSIDTLRNAQRRVVNKLIDNGDKRFVIVEGGELTTTEDLSDDVHLNNQGAKKIAQGIFQIAK